MTLLVKPHRCGSPSPRIQSHTQFLHRDRRSLRSNRCDFGSNKDSSQISDLNGGSEQNHFYGDRPKMNAAPTPTPPPESHPSSSATIKAPYPSPHPHRPTP